MEFTVGAESRPLKRAFVLIAMLTDVPCNICAEPGLTAEYEHGEATEHAHPDCFQFQIDNFDLGGQG